MSDQKIPGCGLHHVAVVTGDWDASFSFYQEGLGFRVRARWGQAPRRAALLDAGDGNYLELFERDVTPVVGEAPIIHLCFRTTDCAAALERAREAGARVTLEPTKPAPLAEQNLDATIAFVQGPSGEVIEFFECAQL